MMEIDIEKRLEIARQNLETYQSREAVASQEAARLNVTILKYQGVIEYLESLKAEMLEPPKAEDDGHGEGKEIPEESPATKQLNKE